VTEHRQIGALPIKVGDDGTPVVMLITSRRRGRWIIPKGWPLEGRSDAEVAGIEAWEEAGLIGVVEEEVFGRFAYLKDDDEGDRRQITVEVYRLVVRCEADAWPESSERVRPWFTVDEAVVRLDDRELAELIERERALLFRGLVA
jgi:8-oxo-dGTP pyrophosphatase MutT (NUDIX family)